jgi:hypothetical protein
VFPLDDLAKLLVLFSLKTGFSKIATEVAHTRFSRVLGFLKNVVETLLHNEKGKHIWSRIIARVNKINSVSEFPPYKNS